jgi:hypothetical protein
MFLPCSVWKNHPPSQPALLFKIGKRDDARRGSFWNNFSDDYPKAEIGVSREKG